MSNPYYPPIQNRDHNSKVWQQWFRKVGERSSDASSDMTVYEAAAGSTTLLDRTNVIVYITADNADATVILPTATTERINGQVRVVLLDATYNGVIQTKSGDTLFGETELIMNEAWMSLVLHIKSTGEWVIL